MRSQYFASEALGCPLIVPPHHQDVERITVLIDRLPQVVSFEITLYLNNKFFLCGRNPNAYANVAWVFGLHDRPWAERQVFGKVRYMTAGGLERKFDIKAYVAKEADIQRSA